MTKERNLYSEMEIVVRVDKDWDTFHVSDKRREGSEDVALTNATIQ